MNREKLAGKRSTSGNQTAVILFSATFFLYFIQRSYYIYFQVPKMASFGNAAIDIEQVCLLLLI